MLFGTYQGKRGVWCAVSLRMNSSKTSFGRLLRLIRCCIVLYLKNSTPLPPLTWVGIFWRSSVLKALITSLSVLSLCCCPYCHLVIAYPEMISLSTFDFRSTSTFHFRCYLYHRFIDFFAALDSGVVNRHEECDSVKVRSSNFTQEYRADIVAHPIYAAWGADCSAKIIEPFRETQFFSGLFTISYPPHIALNEYFTESAGDLV